MGGLLHLVRRGGDRAGPQPAQAPLGCTKCNSPPSTASVPITPCRTTVNLIRRGLVADAVMFARARRRQCVQSLKAGLMLKAWTHAIAGTVTCTGPRLNLARKWQLIGMSYGAVDLRFMRRWV